MGKKYTKGSIKINNKDPIMNCAKPGYKAGNPFIDEDYNNFKKEIIDVVENLKKITINFLPELKKEVNLIINKQIKSCQRIEKTLDNLLTFTQIGVGDKEFKKLNKYYSKINLSYSKEYDKFYKEFTK
jgi:hypothetical protein